MLPAAYRRSMSATRSHLPPTLSVTTSDGITTEYSAPLPRRTELELPSLCAYAENEVSQKNDGGVVGLVATSSLDYLFRQWAAVANKATTDRVITEYSGGCTQTAKAAGAKNKVTKKVIIATIVVDCSVRVRFFAKR